MNPSTRTLLAILGSVAIGAFSALSVAAPAQAEHATITATTDCAEGGWVVDWTMENSTPERHAVIDHVKTSAPSLIDGDLHSGAVLEDRLTTRQVIPYDITDAVLVVGATWDGEPDTVVSQGRAIAPSCDKPPVSEPITIDVEHTCVGLSITVTNPDETGDGHVVLAPSDGEAVSISLEAGASETIVFPAPTDIEIFSVKITGAITEKIVWDRPTDCPAITVNVAENCSGLTFTVANPTDGENAELVFTPDTGAVRNVTVAPGERIDIAFVADRSGYAVTVSSDDFVKSFSWQRTHDCEGLPVTGHSMGLWLASGVGATLVGVVLLVALRWRRQRQ